jgi:hypothetical protein
MDHRVKPGGDAEKIQIKSGNDECKPAKESSASRALSEKTHGVKRPDTSAQIETL